MRNFRRSDLASLVFAGLICRQQSDGFVLRHLPSPLSLMPSSSSTSPSNLLLLAKRSTGGGPSKGKAAKKSKSNKNTKSKKPPKASRTREENQKRAKKPSSSAHAPPWQIVSQKDMKKNIKAEQKRRELAQQGIHNVEMDVDVARSATFLDPADKALLAWKRYAPSPSHQVDFIGAYLNKQLPPRLGAPEIAFLGRSNVGKSSLLNKLVGSETARVGKTPGATASVNLYGIYRKDKAILGLVDLPGFGYAKLSKENKESVQLTAENYLEKRRELVLGILLVDIRREPSEDDRNVLSALYDMGHPIVVVATKVDKMSVNQLEPALEKIRVGLDLPQGQPLCISSMTGQGIKDLWRIIMEACEAGVEEYREKLETGKLKQSDMPFGVNDEEDDIVYSQGFDWKDDSAVMYEDLDGEQEGEEVPYFEDDEDGYWNMAEPEEEVPYKKESITFLRKKARDMERRGEV